jgi:ectoine hydroxylase-related dioxygenase (phytanoyl-CoA dioxygenase family)
VNARTQAQAVLSDEEVARFECDGLLVFDDPVPLDLVDAISAETDAILKDAFDPGPQATVDGVVYEQHPGEQNPEYHWQRVRNAWKVNDNVRRLALLPNVLAGLERLFGRRVMPFQTLNFPVGTEQVSHHDSIAFQSDPPGFMCGVWVALEDVDADNGPLVYYPGSHKLPTPDWDDINRVTGREVVREEFDSYDDYLGERQRQYGDYVTALIERNGLEPRYGTIRKGQALLWHANLLHGGSFQRDKSRTRKSQVTHYFFEGCRVYTPMRNDGDHIFWDYPVWIRDPVPEFSAAALLEAVDRHVPEGATVVMAGAVPDESLDVASRRVKRFPRSGGAAERLEELRAAGANYLVFPATELGYLENQVPEFQAYIEDRYPSVLRDGAVGAIYVLD